MPTPEEEAAAAAAAAAAKGETWHIKLPEDIRADASLADFKDEAEMVSMPVNVARSYINTKKLVGRDKIPMPKTDEEFMEVYNRLGRPKESSEYTMVIPESITNEKLKEGLTEQITWFKDVAHKHGLSDKQATSIFGEFANLSATQVGDLQKTAEIAFSEAEVALRTEYGNAFEGKMVLMNRALDSLDAGTGLKQLITESGLGRHPAVIKTFVKVGEMMAEDLGLDKDSGEIAETPENLEEQKNELMRAKAYTDAKDPAHKDTVRKVAQLLEKIHGRKKVEPTDRNTFINP